MKLRFEMIDGASGKPIQGAMLDLGRVSASGARKIKDALRISGLERLPSHDGGAGLSRAYYRICVDDGHTRRVVEVAENGMTPELTSLIDAIKEQSAEQGMTISGAGNR